MRFGMENIVGHDHRMLKIFDVINSRGRHAGHHADHRRERHGQVAGGPGHPSPQQPPRQAVRGNRLRALPETLLESELFGHVAGAFTGAVGEKLGKFMLADEGTIFLDEISTASPGMQVKLLRVLQDLEFEPVGGTKTFHVDTRVILATNDDLGRLVAEGRFRQDLFYRINVINIELPPLRERIADIPLLAEHFLRQVCEDCGQERPRIHRRGHERLARYRWPGNVRELQNVIERAVLLGKDPMIGIGDLPTVCRGRRPNLVEPVAGRTLKQALESPERQIIREVLEANHWNRNLTAETLGINRTTLYKKMKRLGAREHGDGHGAVEVILRLATSRFCGDCDRCTPSPAPFCRRWCPGRVLLNGTSSETAALERKRQTTLPAIVDGNLLVQADLCRARLVFPDP